MSPSEVATAVRWRLASDIETELASQARAAERIATLRSRLASEPGDWISPTRRALSGFSSAPSKPPASVFFEVMRPG